MLYESLNHAIRDLFGNERKIIGAQPVSGGDINEAYALSLDDGTAVFMKSNTASALEGFQAEVAGLQAIENTNAIRVPKILGIGLDHGKSFLLMEFIRPKSRAKDYWETFATELVNMHHAATDEAIRFGFHENNFIGSSRQLNTPHDTWISFFRDCRLAPQFEMAGACFDSEDRRRIIRLLDHLDDYLIEPETPSLIHGDLWAGNVITGTDGKAWLIDPAAYYGHPEADLAMTELFGGFSSEFYAAYKEALPLEAGYADRRDLYNLYHLLNHLNLFGSGYLFSVKSILRRY